MQTDSVMSSSNFHYTVYTVPEYAAYTREDIDRIKRDHQNKDPYLEQYNREHPYNKPLPEIPPSDQKHDDDLFGAFGKALHFRSYQHDQ